MGFPPPDEFPTLDAVRARWRQVHDALFRFLELQTEESVEWVIHYTRPGREYEGVLWQLMTHVADHATYHRGQQNSMIKLAGGKPSDASYVNCRRDVEGQA